MVFYNNNRKVIKTFTESICAHITFKIKIKNWPNRANENNKKKYSIFQKDVANVNIYIPNNRASNVRKKIVNQKQ